jgi:hypothetical protein
MAAANHLLTDGGNLGAGSGVWEQDLFIPCSEYYDEHVRRFTFENMQIELK